MAKDYDDVDSPRRSTGGGEKGPLDGLYKNKILAILIHIFCNGCFIAPILGLVGFLTAKDPEAKANAKLGLIISAALIVIGTIFYFVLGGAAMVMGNRGQ